MNATKIVGKRKAPQTPAEYHALAAALDRESEALRCGPRERFIFKARTWEELERFQTERLLTVPRERAMSEQAPLLRICSLLNQYKARYLIVGARASS